MAETLTRNESLLQLGEIDLEAIRSRIIEISKEREDGFESVDSSISDRQKLLENCISEFQETINKLESQELSISDLDDNGLDLYLDCSKKEINLILEENAKLPGEIDSLMDKIATDKLKMDGGLAECECLIRCVNSQGLVSENLRDICGSQEFGVQDLDFEMFKLDHQISENEMRLKDMEDLESFSKSIEMLELAESMLSDVKVLEYKDNIVRLFLKGPVPTPNGTIFGQKVDFGTEKINSDHELSIEINEETMDIKKIEIFPDDVPINEIFNTIKISRGLFSSEMPLLEHLVRLVQYHVILSSVRRLLLKDANKSRYSFEYSEREKIVKVHMDGGIDALIKVSPNWPFSSFGLILISIKSSNPHSQNLSLSFLIRIKELANNLDPKTRCHLVQFVEAIEEILVKEIQSNRL